jgi:hypothetical protein
LGTRQWLTVVDVAVDVDGSSRVITRMGDDE